jgi:hypothetical protein
MLNDPRLPHRFWSRVRANEVTGCWEWVGGKTGRGYGAYHVNSRTLGAHRVAYRVLVGEPGPALDHLCRNVACVNPAHLEPVTVGENVLRGVSFSAVNARKDECSNGHPLSGENLYTKPNGRRVCRVCRRANQAPWARAKRKRGLDAALGGEP